MTVVSRIAHEGGGLRPADDGRPWWDSLPADFCASRERFEMTGRDRAKVAVTAASDVVLRTVAASLVSALAIPVGFHPLALRRALRGQDFYARLAESGDPERVFRPPPRGVAVRRRRARLPLFRPSDGVCDDLSFVSPFVPLYAAERAAYLRHGKNRIARARHWRHAGPPRPTVLAVHGFSADLYHLNEWFFSIPWLYREGYDVLLVTLPFHGKRQTRLSPFSGHGYFAGGVNRIHEATAQAITDLRVFMGYLSEERGVPRMGVTGVSLGGHAAALLAGVEPSLAFAIPNVPVTSIADLVLEWEPIASFVRAALAATGKDVHEARRLLSVSCPLTYRALLPRERLMVIGGVGDRLAPPTHSRLLWDHWQRCRIHWFPGSHLIHLDRGQYFRQMRLFLRDIAFAPA
jgi:hypothetical protein